MDEDENEGGNSCNYGNFFIEYSFLNNYQDVIPDEPICDYTLRDPLLFGDYRNAVNESEPRFYEDLLDYEAILFLFQEVHSKVLFHK